MLRLFSILFAAFCLNASGQSVSKQIIDTGVIPADGAPHTFSWTYTSGSGSATTITKCQLWNRAISGSTSFYWGTVNRVSNNGPLVMGGGTGPETGGFFEYGLFSNDFSNPLVLTSGDSITLTVTVTQNPYNPTPPQAESVVSIWYFAN